MKRLTNSECKQWRHCRRLWWLSTYRRLGRRNDLQFNKPLGIGNRVHDALAEYYDPETQRDPLDFLSASVSADLAVHPEAEEDIRKEADLSEAILSGYLDWLAETGVDQSMRVIEAERAVVVPLVDEVQLLSKLDARVEHEELGGRFAIEHKTVSGSVKPPAHLRFDTQFLTEHLAELLDLQRQGREHAVARGVLWNALLKSKRTPRARGPFYAREAVRHNMQQLRSHWHHLVATADEIMSATRKLDDGASHHSVCPPNPTRDCSWMCPFVRVCQNLDADPDNAEMQLATQFETQDPLARYRDLLPDHVESN